MAILSQYTAWSMAGEVVMQASSGQQVVLPMELINRSITLRTIFASSRDDEVTLTFPSCLLENWIRCTHAGVQTLLAASIPTLVAYLEACDYFADEQRLSVLCTVLGRKLFTVDPTSPQSDPQMPFAPPTAPGSIAAAGAAGPPPPHRHFAEPLQMPSAIPIAPTFAVAADAAPLHGNFAAPPQMPLSHPRESTGDSELSRTDADQGACLVVPEHDQEQHVAPTISSHRLSFDELRPGQVLEGLAVGLATSVLAATPFHLDYVLSRLPHSMHSVALHAEFPEFAATGQLELHSNAYTLSTVTAALEMFRKEGGHNSRRLQLSVEGISCLNSPDARSSSNSGERRVNTSVRRFSDALLGCCGMPECVSVALGFSGDEVNVDEVLEALACRERSLKKLCLYELPNIHFFSFTRKSRLRKRNEQAELLARGCAQLSVLQHLHLASQTKWADNIVHASACWDVSAMSQLTYLSMHDANCCACAVHFSASVPRCTKLVHLGVRLNLRKCQPDASGHNRTWLASLRRLTSLTLRVMDERVSFRNGLSFSHGGGEAHDYVTGLVTRSFSALTGLQQLDLSHNLIRVSQLQYIVSYMHGSLRDLALAMHVTSVPHALSIVHILHRATLLAKLSFDYHCFLSVEAGELAEEPHESLCKYLCCLRSLRHLRLRMHAGPDLPVVPPHIEASQKVPIGTAAALTCLNLNSQALLDGVVSTAHAHLTSLQCITAVMKSHADGSTATASLQFAKIISQQSGLKSLNLSSSGMTPVFVQELANSTESFATLSQVCIESSHAMPADTAFVFGSFLSCCSLLTSLSLQMHVSSAFPEHLATALFQLQELKDLTLQLTLQYDSVPRRQSNSAFEVLASSIGSRACLRSLHMCLYGSGLADSGAVVLARQLARCAALQCLCLQNVRVSEVLIQTLAVSASSLKYLKLRGGDMHVDAAKALAKFLADSPSLRSVSVRESQSFSRGPDFQEGSRVILEHLHNDDPLRCLQLREECA